MPLPEPRSPKGKPLSVLSIKPTQPAPNQAASLDSGWRRARASADRSSRKAQPVEPTRRTRPVPRGRPTLTTHCHGCSRFWRCRLRYPALTSSFLHPPPHSRAARTLGSLLLRLFPVLYGFYGGGAVASASGYCGNGRRRKSGSGDCLSSPRAYGFKPLCFREQRPSLVEIAEYLFTRFSCFSTADTGE